MGTWTCIRTEKQLGPHLSKAFQSFTSGPDTIGEDCELQQIERLIELSLHPFTVRNYSGLWDESNFPGDSEEKEKLIFKQIEEDKVWNDLSKFLSLVKLLLVKAKEGFFSDLGLNFQESWSKDYFNTEGTAIFIEDLEIIEVFLMEAKADGDQQTAFYIS